MHEQKTLLNEPCKPFSEMHCLTNSDEETETMVSKVSKAI